MPLNVYKRLGETPLQTLDRFRENHKEYVDSTLSYIGRLDPLAEGAMLVLVGDENKERSKYLELEKEYEFKILFGFSTDTGDVLGLCVEDELSSVLMNDVKKAVNRFMGKIKMEYPAYSSKTVGGIALFEYARNGNISKIKIPEKEVEIYNIAVVDFKQIGLVDLKNEIISKISKVRGDFRQDEIIKRWNEILDKYRGRFFNVASVKVSCSSGTYMRTLAYKIGQYIGSSSLALSIKRTKIGLYLAIDSIP
jgi:tRNA pseudouridine55 synthase